MKKLLTTAFIFILGFSTFSDAVDFIVTPEWVKENLGKKDVVIVDVQDKPDDYEKEHIPQAVKVSRNDDLAKANKQIDNYYYPDAIKFQALMSKLGITNNSIVVAYDNKMSLFASRFAAIMDMYGHDINKIKILNGGIAAWKAKGFEVESGEFKPKKSTYKVGKKKDITVNKNYLLNIVKKKPKDVIILDSRPYNEYTGENKRAQRAGFIPGAINVTGSDVINNKDQTFKSLEEIKAAYESKGITPDKTIITYCHSGDRSAHTYFVLKYMLGYDKIKIYDGSWFEWANTPELPIENINK